MTNQQSLLDGLDQQAQETNSVVQSITEQTNVNTETDKLQQKLSQ